MKEDKILLSAVQVRKRYKGRTILQDISLEVHQSEAVFLVGVNGSGKSTLLRILSGLTVPDAGVVTRDSNITMAFIPDRMEKINMKLCKFMAHMSAMDEMSMKEEELMEYFRQFHMENMLDTPMKYLSKGTLQKVAVMQALLSERNLIFMDEPLSGQDTMSKLFFIKEMKRRKAEGTALVIACHDNYLIEELADRIYQIDNGKLVSGEDYTYGKSMKKGVFLLRKSENFDKVFPRKDFLCTTDYGTVIKLEADMERVNSVFKLCLENEITIMRYEELGERI